MRRSMRLWIVLSGLLFASLFASLLAGCQGAEQAVVEAGEPIKITACVSSPSANQMPFVYADEKGLFEKYGLDVELITFNSGADAATALITGDVDICQVAGTSVINAALAGEDLVFIGSIFNRHLYSVVVQPEIKTVADLPGTTFAISKPGGLPDSLMRIAVAQWGLEVDQDVYLLSVGSQSERLAAMETGAVDGTVLSVPETSLAKAAGYEIFLDLGELDVSYPSISIATRQAFLVENRPAAVQFMRAVIEAISAMKADRESTLQVMAEYLLLDREQDAALLTEAYDVLIVGRLDAVPFAEEDGIQALIDQTRLENPDFPELQASRMIDNSLVAELVDALAPTPVPTSPPVLQPPPIPLTVCVSSTSANQMPFIYAQERGLFERYGLAVDFVTFNSGTDAAIALVTGDVDICQIAGSAVVYAALAGEDLVFIGGLFNRHLYSVVTRPEIQSVDDLIGTTFAISKPGSSTDSMMRIAIQYWGLVVDQDISLLSVGNQGERLAAMETGQVDGTVLSIPETSQAKELGYLIFLDLGELDLAYPSISIAASQSFIGENRATVLQFMKAVSAAIQLMKQNREDTIQVMAAYLMLDPVVDAALLNEAYEVLIQERLESVPYSLEAGVQEVIDLARLENPEAPPLSAAALIDNSFVAELEASGFFQSLQP